MSGIHVLTWEDFDGTPRSHELLGEEVTIGRAPERLVRLASGDVSRAHCRLVRTPRGWSVADDGSLDGTYVNGEPVTEPRDLAAGDVIRLGRFGLMSLTFRRRAALSSEPSLGAAWDARSDPGALLVALLASASATLDVEDVLGLVIETGQRLTGLPSGTAWVQDGRRLREAAARGEPASGAGLEAARQAHGLCAPVVEPDGCRVALPLRTFDGDRMGSDLATGVRRAAGAVVLEGPGAAADVGALALQLLQSACDLAAVHVAHAAEYERATRDALTGLRNRGWFDQALERQAQRCARSGVSLGLGIVDLDRFKAINDGHGHPAGDAVLAEAARRVRDVVGGQGVACRYGGEEIALLLPGLDEADALRLAERVREAIAAEPVQVAGSSGTLGVPVTASVGVACRSGSSGLPLAALLAAADGALYRAKAEGRNRVEAAPGA